MDSIPENGSLEAAVKTTFPVINNILVTYFVLPLFAAIIRLDCSNPLQPPPDTRGFRSCCFCSSLATAASISLIPYASSDAEQHAILRGKSLCPATQSAESSQSNIKAKELKPFQFHWAQRMYVLEYGLINHKLLIGM